MAATGATLFQELDRFVRGFGVDVCTRPMDLEKPGEFDGPTITINPKHDLEACSYYLAHSFGSIAQWSTDFDRSREIFDDLRRAREKNRTRPLQPAIEAWRQFEEGSSDHAVWVLEQIGRADIVPDYTVFFRADLEAMTIFHRTGKEPPWPEFLADWKHRVWKGEICVEPFRPKPVPRFPPVRIPKQEVLQERE